jgi:hypothetical protein
VRRAVLALILLAALGAGLARAASEGGPGVSRCALGSATTSTAKIEASALSAARTKFEGSLHGVPANSRAGAGAQFASDLAAYLYGYPIVMERRTTLSFPHNSMVAIGRLANTDTVTVVAPNHDTLYSVGQLDLSGGPIVITTPPTGGRYSVIQLIDGFTNVSAYLGDGAAARTGESAVLVPPGYTGTLPKGLAVIHPATKLLTLLGRTLASGTTDTAAAVVLLRRYSVTPLAAYEAGTRVPPLVLANFPKRTPVKAPTGTAFFDELAEDMIADPAPAADRCAISAFAGAGVGLAGKVPQPASSSAGRALTAAAAAGPGVLNALVAGVRHSSGATLGDWTTTPPDTAQFGTHYADRAVVAAIGLDANTNAKALYLTQDRDSKHRALTGAHSYRVRFAPGQLPPVSAFWSLTLYDSRLLFYPNSLNRYAVGDRTAGLKRDRDGGLTVIVSHRAPPASERSNWLPAPPGSFSLYMRLYQPKPAVTHGHWLPPAVVRTR